LLEGREVVGRDENWVGWKCGGGGILRGVKRWRFDLKTVIMK
jgi:hypothetical protein